MLTRFQYSSIERLFRWLLRGHLSDESRFALRALAREAGLSSLLSRLEKESQDEKHV